MRKILLYSAALVALSAAPALAQEPKPTAATGSSADTTAGASGLKAGLSVKDSTGATIGKVAGLKTDAAGKRVASIRIGSDTVAVEADRLTVADGVATVDATQAELKATAKKPKS